MEKFWTRVKDQQPPQGRVVETKIDDEKGERNIQPMKLNGRLWWLADGSMYVYYEPTHWRFLNG